jgi:uncharacterized protein involved in exopolysaccharide biosynthesis
MSRQEIILSRQPIQRVETHSLREIVEIAHRRRKTFGSCFALIFLSAVVATILTPKRYESELKILVHRDRIDPIVTAQQTAAVQQNLPSLTEEDINSEVSILKSEDLLEEVVRKCGLQYRTRASLLDRLIARYFPEKKEDENTAVRIAAGRLASRLRIEPIKKSYVISVSYSDSDPLFAAKVLNTLGDLYLQKHASVYRPNDAFQFFNKETQEAKQQMDAAEQRLADFNRAEGLVTERPEKVSDTSYLAQFELGMHQTQASIPELEEQVETLETLLSRSPQRITTQEHTADNGALLQQLKSSLVNLETQRTDLTTKYAPGDRMVKEVETQIAQVKAAITAQEKAPLREETTDQNPTYEYLRQELVKTRAQLSAARALAASSEKVDRTYRQALIKQDQAQLQQQILVKDAKAAEDNYLLYLNKREEARISNAFDKSRILNVSIAQKATVPYIPSNPTALLLVLGWLFACIASTGVVLVQEKLDAPLRTPEQIGRYLDAPVIAYLPKHGYESSQPLSQ